MNFLTDRIRPIYFKYLSAAFAVSVGRGMVLSGILIYALPAVAGAESIWFAMPVTELLIAVFAALMMYHGQKKTAAYGGGQTLIDKP